MRLPALKKGISVALIAMLSVLSLSVSMWSSAASLGSSRDTLSTIKAGELAGHVLRIETPSGVQYSETVLFSFSVASSFVFGALDVNDYDILASSLDCDSATIFTDLNVAASAGANTWGVATSGNPVLLTLTAPSSGTGQVAAGGCMEVRIGSTASGGTDVVTNPITPGVYRVTTGGTFGDSGFTDVVIIGEDVVTVTANVDQHITFSITGTDVDYGLATTQATRYATPGAGSGGSSVETVGNTFRASTNALTGYTITVQGVPPTAFNLNTLDPIGTTSSIGIPGIEQFGIRLSAVGGSGTVLAPYNDVFPQKKYAYGGTLSASSVVGSPASSVDTVYSVYYMANIHESTPGGNYEANFDYIASVGF